MFLFVRIYKEKKEEDYRIIILPSGRSKIGLVQTKEIESTQIPVLKVALLK